MLLIGTVLVRIHAVEVGIGTLTEGIADLGTEIEDESHSTAACVDMGEERQLDVVDCTAVMVFRIVVEPLLPSYLAVVDLRLYAEVWLAGPADGSSEVDALLHGGQHPWGEADKGEIHAE